MLKGDNSHCASEYNVAVLSPRGAENTGRDVKNSSLHAEQSKATSLQGWLHSS